jgi:peptidoglycan/xylan/chitin deacetylase (PgdA/CDA1 family)
MSLPASPIPRLTVALTFDHDAIAAHVHDGSGPVALSRGHYGGRVGIWRVLELLDRQAIKATFFVPVHTALSFPDGVRAIIDGGHEIGSHGWFHEDLAKVPASDERALLERSLETLTSISNVRPIGFRAPYWSLSDTTLHFADELGYDYDSSLMADDARPYFVEDGVRHDASGGSSFGPRTKLVEFPVSRTLDDWPYFEPSRNSTGASIGPRAVLEIWADEIGWLHEHEQGGVVTLTMHPEVIGRPGRISMLERLIGRLQLLEGLRFSRLDDALADWRRQGSPERHATPLATGGVER